jgi:signal transduction histidine kinase
MQLRTRLLLTSVMVAVPAAALVTYAVESWRSRDTTLALRRVVTGLVNEHVRDRCEADPGWFLTGPLDGRPKRGEPVNPDPDAWKPRAKLTNQPFELFAYDDEFIGSSVATPRFPNDLRRAMRQADGPVVMPFDSPDGRGVQVALWTGWKDGPCAILVGRMRPAPYAAWTRLAFFGGTMLLCVLVGLAVSAQTLWRVRRLAAVARESAQSGFGSIAPETRRDEIGSLAFTYNEAARALQLRAAGMSDRDDAMRRFMASVSDEIASPRDVQDLSARLANLVATARLRGKGDPIRQESIDLGALIKQTVDRATPAARAAGVSLTIVASALPVTITADRALVERALDNLLDNAIRYNRSAGHVTVTLARKTDTQFSLRVTDDGRGVRDEELKSLNAIRRFRGDEGRYRERGVPGLGLTVAREVVERLGFQMELRRPSAGGFEVEISS